MLAPFVLVLQVGVKHIPNHNNHVPLGQLRDLTAHENYHEYPKYLYTKIKIKTLSMYVYLSVENLMTNFRAIMAYVFHFGFIIYRKVNSG